MSAKTPDEVAAALYCRNNLEKFIAPVSRELVRIVLAAAYMEGKQDQRDEDRAKAVQS